MTVARLRVTHAGPHVTFQDVGRPGRMREGIPTSGPMDRLAHSIGNIRIGNSPDATSIEVSRAGLDIECLEGGVTIAVTGGGFVIRHNSNSVDPWTVVSLQRTDSLSIRAGSWGSWTYLAVTGEIAATAWLGRTSTHTPSGFGGGALRTGQEILIENTRLDPARNGAIAVPNLARPTSIARVVVGPQDHRFEAGALSTFLGNSFEVSTAADRMGVRLIGARLDLKDALSIPSEPIVKGSVQVAGEGQPTVLLADHQTTGGYPKIATVISSDLDRFAQLQPGDEVRFEQVEPAEAVDIARTTHEEAADTLRAASLPTLTQRLLKENLIGWLAH